MGQQSGDVGLLGGGQARHDVAPAPLGVEGAIRLESPLFASLPSHDLLTEDRGRLDAVCPCGAPTPALTYLDRLSAPTGTCAATAVTA